MTWSNTAVHVVCHYTFLKIRCTVQTTSFQVIKLIKVTSVSYEHYTVKINGEMLVQWKEE